MTHGLERLRGGFPLSLRFIREQHEALQRRPITTAATLTRDTGLTPATVNKALARLTEVGIVSEIAERRRGRVFAYRAYMERLDAELDDAPPAAPRAARRRQPAAH